MLTCITFIIGLAGAVALTIGAWLIMPAAGWLTGGALALLWSYMMSRSIAAAAAAKKGGN